MNTSPESPSPVPPGPWPPVPRGTWPPVPPGTGPTVPQVAPSASAPSRPNAGVVALLATLLVAVLAGGALLVHRSGDGPNALNAAAGGRLELMSAIAPDGDASPTGSSSTGPSTSVPAAGSAGAGQAGTGSAGADRRAERRAAMDAAIARHLGVSVDQLHEARLAALGERLDGAVERGRITRAQADELLAAAREGRLRAALRELRTELREQRRAGR